VANATPFFYSPKIMTTNVSLRGTLLFVFARHSPFCLCEALSFLSLRGTECRGNLGGAVVRASVSVLSSPTLPTEFASLPLRYAQGFGSQ